jgi:molecular chaperone GrpE
MSIKKNERNDSMADKKEDAVKQAIKDAQEAAMEAEQQESEAAPQDTEQDAEKAQEAGAGADEGVGADETAPQETAEPSAKEMKKKEKADRKKEKDKAKERIEELEDKVKRQLAEFENFRNRTEKEKGQMFDMGAKSVLEKILPVIDNFERGLGTVPEDEAGKPFAEGMNMIYKQLLNELDAIGVKPIEAVGKEFNPDFHNAVMQVESEEFESGFVAQELQKGYMYRDTVIRHSMVAVVQ